MMRNMGFLTVLLFLLIPTMMSAQPTDVRDPQPEVIHDPFPA